MLLMGLCLDVLMIKDLIFSKTILLMLIIVCYLHITTMVIITIIVDSHCLEVICRVWKIKREDVGGKTYFASIFSEIHANEFLPSSIGMELFL